MIWKSVPPFHLSLICWRNAFCRALTKYFYSSCCSCCWGRVTALQPHPKSLRLSCFKLDWDEIWQECSSHECTLIDGVSCLIWCHNFKTVAMTSFHTEDCCHLGSENKASAQRPHGSFCQFLIYSTLVLIIGVFVDITIQMPDFFICWSGW